MNPSKPYILITNDDGINAPGINALIKEVGQLGDIEVVAPSVERSAVGHAITLSDPLRVWKFKKNTHWQGYAVSGTPADCVKIAVNSILDRSPDLVISGINLGSNTGINVIYSGTVSAATEGTILGIPSFAISLTTYQEPDFALAARFAVKIARQVLRHGLPKRTLLNVNVPNVPEEEIKGIVITRQGMAPFAEEFERRVDPKNRAYYWMGGSKTETVEGNDVDDVVVKQQKISITPIKYDLTNYGFMAQLQQWLPEINLESQADQVKDMDQF